MLQLRHVNNRILGLIIISRLVASAAPSVCPRYTILPSTPSYALFIPRSALMTVDPAGSIPTSTLQNRFAKKTAYKVKYTNV